MATVARSEMKISVLSLGIFVSLCHPVITQTTPNEKPQIYYLHIQSDIKYRFATTLVTSKVVNPTTVAKEAKFDVTLPDEAFISDFVMEIGGKLYPGNINEKEKAKKKYDTAKKKGQSAGHVSQKPRQANRFSVDVNVGPQEKVTFNLTYQELLYRSQGTYEHVIYIDPGQIVPDLRIDVAIEESRDITSITVPPLRNDLLTTDGIQGNNALAVINRPSRKSARIQYYPTEADQRARSDQGIAGLFVVEYDIEREEDAGDILVVNGYFVHFFAPSNMDPLPKDVLFILDVSGSMSGTKLKQMKDAMVRILDELHEGDRFNIMTFSSGIHFWRPGTVLTANRQTIRAAKNYAKGIGTGGYTNINDAMLRGIEFLEGLEGLENRSQIIMFLTDGQPSAGETNINNILRNIQEQNGIGLPVYSLAFGRGADYEFVKKVAVQNNGVSRRIYEDSDAVLQIAGFYNEISAASLKNISFKYLEDANSDVSNLTDMNFNSYLSGSELIVAGKLDDNTIRVFDLKVQGLGSEGAVELALTSDIQPNVVPNLTKSADYQIITEKIWAYMTIKELLEKSIGSTDKAEKDELKARALDLSLKYKFVTPLTSMVVTKPDEQDVGNLEEGEDAALIVGDKNAGIGAYPPSGGSSSGGSSSSSISSSSGGGSSSGSSSSSSSSSSGSSSGSSSSSRGGGSGSSSSSRGGGSSSGSSSSKRRYSSGGSYGGGGGGDPHFVIRMRGMGLPICFDILAEPGNVLRMLRDQINGITVNARIIQSSIRRVDGHFRTYIGEIMIFHPSVTVDINPRRILVNNTEISWDDERVSIMGKVAFSVIYFGDNVRVLQIDFGNNVQLQIKSHRATTNMTVDYLNLYFNKEAGLSRNSEGILGEFVHDRIRVRHIRFSKKNQVVGSLKVTHKGVTSRVRTVLTPRANTIRGEKEQCWNAHRNIHKLMEKDLKDYFIKDIHQRA